MELRVWKLREAVMKQQIVATIPDLLFMKIWTKGTVCEIWEALKKDFQNKSQMVSVDLQRQLQQQNCAEKGDVQSHFDTLHLMHKDLASIGHSPLEDNFHQENGNCLLHSFISFFQLFHLLYEKGCKSIKRHLVKL
jgi:hypothetical protein